MPILNNVTTKDSELVWKSPDGQRELFKVGFDIEGKPFSAKTYSGAIATEGWTGDILVEERPGKNGSETFVKQAPREDGAFGGQPSTGGRPAGNTPRDDSHIKAQWAIGQSVTVHNEVADLNATDLQSVESLAVEFFDMVDRVKNAHKEDESVDVVHEVTEELDMSTLDSVFGNKAEGSWKPKS